MWLAFVSCFGARVAINLYCRLIPLSYPLLNRSFSWIVYQQIISLMLVCACSTIFLMPLYYLAFPSLSIGCVFPLNFSNFVFCGQFFLNFLSIFLLILFVDKLTTLIVVGYFQYYRLTLLCFSLSLLLLVFLLSLFLLLLFTYSYWFFMYWTYLRRYVVPSWQKVTTFHQYNLEFFHHFDYHTITF